MFAFGLTLALFAFWGVVGLAVVKALRTGLHATQEMLLAPTVGLVLTVVPVFLLSWFGLPVSRFGHALTVVMLIVAGLLLLASRPRLPWRDAAPFGAALLLAAVLTGWPMFEFGFNWLSLCNDDMANYCLAAERLYHNSYTSPPTLDVLLNGRDYSQFYWFFHVPSMSRAGSELCLAWAVSVSGRTVHETFMPLLMAFHLCLVSATGALVYQSPRMRGAALAACLLMAASAMSTFGAVYQLIAQVGGLAMLAACATALMRPFEETTAPDGRPGAAARPEPRPPTSAPASTSPAGARKATRWLLARRGILVGLLGAGLFALYPEVIPMLALAWVLYTAAGYLRRRGTPAATPLARSVIAVACVAAITCAVLLGRYLVMMGVYLFGQATGGSRGGDFQNTFYPFFMLPSGLADLWGFFPLTRVPPEPLSSLTIGVGAALLIASVVFAAWLVRREQPVGAVAAIMVALGLYLFYQGAAFGLYKLAMFVQPFLLGTLAAGWWLLVPERRRVLRVVPLVAVALPGLFIQQGYVQASRGKGQGMGYGEVVDPSGSRLNARFRELLAAHNAGPGEAAGVTSKPAGGPKRVVSSDTYNVVLAKFQAVYTRGNDASFPSARVGTGMMGFNLNRSVAPQWAQALAWQLYGSVNDRFRRPEFNLYPGGAGPPGVVRSEGGTSAAPGRTRGAVVATAADERRVPSPPPSSSGKPGTSGGVKVPRPADGFSALQGGPDAKTNPFILRPLGPDLSSAQFVEGGGGGPELVFVGTGGKQSVFNRWHGPAGGPGGPDRNFFAAPLRAVRDHLLFVESQLGRGYYLNQRDIAMYQLEPDPRFYAGSTMAGTGRHVLFEVLNPSPQVRMVLEFSTSLMADYENRLPPALAIGDRRVPFGVTGRGSARVFSQPMQPQVIEGRPFVGLDMGRDVGPFPQRRRGLMRLYGRGFNLDFRLLTGFTRDVSLVSERQYAAIRAPQAIQSFPKDLQNPQLEYSGIYEDGALSDWSWLALGRPWNASSLVLKGSVPKINDPDFSTEMTVLVDGQEIARRTLGVGYTEQTIPLPPALAPTPHAPGRRKVEVKFSNFQRLPVPDGRPVSFYLAYFGLEAAPAPPAEVRDFSAAMGDRMLEPSGLDGDGWAAQRVSVRLTRPPDRGQLAVRGMVPRVDAAGFTTTLRVRVDGTPVAEQALPVGDFETRVDLPGGADGSAAPHRVELEFSDVQRLPAPDGRTVGARLSFLGFEAPPAPPTWVGKLPDDLKLPLLGATGVSEDRWALPSVTARLAQPADAHEFVVRGMVPQVAQGATVSTDVVVLVDGREAGRQTLPAGPFEVRVPVPEPASTTGAGGGMPEPVRQVEIRFSNPQTLPAPDGRTVGARLDAFGFPPTVSEW